MEHSKTFFSNGQKNLLIALLGMTTVLSLGLVYITSPGKLEPDNHRSLTAARILSLLPVENRNVSLVVTAVKIVTQEGPSPAPRAMQAQALSPYCTYVGWQILDATASMFDDGPTEQNETELSVAIGDFVGEGCTAADLINAAESWWEM